MRIGASIEVSRFESCGHSEGFRTSYSGVRQANPELCFKNYAEFYKARINVNDFIWAGLNVELRILEVLPAATLRLPKAITITQLNKDVVQLQQTLEDLKLNKETGHDFLEMPYAKIKTWMNLRLNDKRTKPSKEKKILKNFRLTPAAIQKIEEIRKKKGLKTETDVIETLIANS